MLRLALKKASQNQRSENESKKKKAKVEDNLDSEIKLNILGQDEENEADHLLENAVLGGEQDFIDNLIKSDQVPKKKKKLHQHGRLDKRPAWSDEDDNKILYKEVKENFSRRTVDKTDVNQSYKKIVDKRFKKVFATPKWALAEEERRSEDSEDEDSTDAVLQVAGDLLEQPEFLPKGTINFKQCKDLNHSTKTEGNMLRNVEFHPKSSVSLVGGLSGIVTLHQVDGKLNPKIQSVQFKNFPIYTAHFSADGNEFIVGSQNFAYFYYYDMLAGKIVNVPRIKDLHQENMQRFKVSPAGNLLAFQGRYGYIHLFTSKTKEWIGSLKMNSSCRALAFNHDGSRLYSHGDDGEVFVWDMNTRDCICKFYDDGCIRGTALAVSPNDRYLACGSDSGIANLYDTSTLLDSYYPKPVKTLTNLTTSISNLKFNCTSEILLMSSEDKDNAIRLVHVPSLTVFSNFPIPYKTLKRPLGADFSLNSGYFAVSTKSGSAFLYRLKHYTSY